MTADPVAQIGRDLARLMAAQEDNDLARIATEGNTTLIDQHGQDLWDCQETLERVAADTTATTFEGVVFQVILAGSYLDRIYASVTPKTHSDWRILYRLIYRILEGLENLTDVDRDRFGAERYMLRKLDPKACIRMAG